MDKQLDILLWEPDTARAREILTALEHEDRLRVTHVQSSSEEPRLQAPDALWIAGPNGEEVAKAHRNLRVQFADRPCIVIPTQISYEERDRLEESGVDLIVLSNEATPLKLLHATRHSLRRRQLRQREVRRRDVANPVPVTAQIYGMVPLREGATRSFEDLVSRYGELLDRTVRCGSPRTEGEVLEELSSLAEQLGQLQADSRDVLQIHSTTMVRRAEAVDPSLAVSYKAAGSRMALELVSRVLNYYQKQVSGGASRLATREVAGS